MTGVERERPSLVVLAKDASLAKTRLGLPREEARHVALLLAAATVRAGVEAETTGAVLVVTGDPDIAVDARQAGADVVLEPRPLGMVRAAARGRERAFAARPTSPVAFVVADLPCLRPADIDAVVGEFLTHGAPMYVADHRGTGTTFLVHGAGRWTGIGFGRHSASMHRRLGYSESAVAPPGLRFDLDVQEDLERLPLAHRSKWLRVAETGTRHEVNRRVRPKGSDRARVRRAG